MVLSFKIVRIVALSVTLFGGVQDLFSQVNVPSYNYSDCDFEVIGHRGYSDVYPENTLLSIEEAFKRGVKYCEIDINITSDDVYVLYHDQPTMYRASSGQGYVVSSTYAELLELDFGRWKGSQFTNTKIATLEEALILAEKYDAYLYLDTKKTDHELMCRVLQNSKVDPKRMLPAVASIDEAKKFKAYCPNSSFIYFGGLPENINDNNWYKEMVDLGCVIFETYYTFALDETNEDFKTFLSKVHENNAKVWVFTSNNIEEIKKLKNAGVDGVESDIATSALKSICEGIDLDTQPIRATTGNWNFDKGNLYSTGVGSQLRHLNYTKDYAYQPVQFGTTSTFNIKPINGIEAPIAKIPAFDPNNGLFIFTNFTSGLDANLHYNYTLIMDIYIPKESSGQYISLFQTNPDNDNDAELFIDSGGIGVSNEYHNPLKPETWYRLGIVVSENEINKYIDGKFIGKNEISGGRWSVYNVFAGGQDQGFSLFSDNDNETSEFFVNAIQLRNYSMKAEDIAILGNVNAKGIPIGNSGIYNVKATGEIASSIVNWDKREVYIKFSTNVDLSKTKLFFDIPYGAKSSIESGSLINLTPLNKKYEILTISSEDGNSTTNWTLIPILESN
ncbi:glycerophosphoryl diester phosphodiesterase [Gillisia mitskevichiae]|uniref:Glycerophosphoryl diester phosphodiesterase n=1 Tax=Gillisia mitskevichiae TaxID=270921 RepID=A0A495PKL0_9FLAO|nr:glycerophosphodiester phosphodiesterase family protein [Gillisia mitskevichiae]RKS50516.1 glycerophosphoryl diester phosphodiesterase [Gillisia mitskevichiae]